MLRPARLALPFLLIMLGTHSFAAEVEEPEAADFPDSVSSPFQAVDNPPPATPPAAAAPVVQGETGFTAVKLRVLNKVIARSSEIEAPVGGVVRFGTIEVITHACWRALPEEQPENAALLEISEVRQGEAPARIFLGWMYASSPALSALEHPFYDVTVMECMGKTEGEHSPKE